MAALLIALSSAFAAPGQSGVVYPSAVPADHTVRVGVGGGAIWFIGEGSAGLTALDVSIQPVDGLQVSGMLSLQTNGRIRQDPGFLAVTGTLPSRGNVRVAASVGFGSFDGRHGGAAGILMGNHKGRVGWDLGAYPLVAQYTPDWGWSEVEGGDRSPRWDFRTEWRTVTAGVDFGMSQHWRVRVGVPDGLTFSLATRRFWLDVGGATLYHLGGGLYLKSGVRF